VNGEPLNLILERARQGDSEATRELVAAYEPYLRLIVRRSLPDSVRPRFDSVDVVQSVWVHLLGGLQAGAWHFADRAHLQAFLAKVARRRLISRIRHHAPAARREEPVAAGLDALPGREGHRPSEVAQASELWERMLALCPPDHHELLRLRKQGLTLDEIASRTNLHEGSVRRILRQLARQLALLGDPVAEAP
jgi:RNA polymerase sigma-70 factor (ECF subfamily)